MKYLQLLAQSFPNIPEASTEIINLQAILNLPKGTEHFVADIHGEYEAFLHILKNASGNIQRKVNELFGNLMRESDARELCTLIYYPDQKLELIKAAEENIDNWYHITIHNLSRFRSMNGQVLYITEKRQVTFSQVANISNPIVLLSVNIQMIITGPTHIACQIIIERSL